VFVSFRGKGVRIFGNSFLFILDGTATKLFDKHEGNVKQ
jgi:hypothetical protein